MPTYSEARVSWEAHKDSKDYQTYADEFIQFNNHNHLDEKDGCYALAGAPVQLMLVITHRDDEKYALVEDVLTDTDSPKAQCFKKTYRGIRTKVPPPFCLSSSK
ncbi:hypothetical protein LQ772_05915 [Frateuria edaphi]|uniref:hypothetical protein n=1 Tax=Frateuria edaphi TaxID=2898793 RepID=UPI001E3F8E95|nr:hypothetical protein [Frateuria edaphi]UGB46830.1 hypothetical protein LQ772_05915 [Frateuria edaphi]